MILDSVELDPLTEDRMQLEQVQAWTLISIYELMRVNYRRGWMSAGKLFRSAILLKLHTIDGCDEAFINSSLSVAEVEERRRTFWMVYAVDRFASLMDQLPLTFHQHLVGALLSS